MKNDRLARLLTSEDSGFSTGLVVSHHFFVSIATLEFRANFHLSRDMFAEILRETGF